MNLNDPKELASLLEAFLLASGKPQSLERLFELFEEGERPEPAVFKKALVVLEKSCAGRAFELKEVATGYRIQVREMYAPWVGRLWEERPQRYSRAMLETLALVAYRQPITRGEIEDVRGVAVNSHIVKTLLEREWIRVVGYRDVPGKPAMFATTKLFLDHFNLKNLDELPPLAALRELEPEPMLGFDQDDLPVPEGLQARADTATEGEEGAAPEPSEEKSFGSLLAELDMMEEGLKTDFDDLPDDYDPPVPEGLQARADMALAADDEDEQPMSAEEALQVLRSKVATQAVTPPPEPDEESEEEALARAIREEQEYSRD
ncbi:MAG: SMC-Scp complex subunit ScpB [Pseudomonas sp.]|uniref:SMC-Scp complex subunit ScpB n=1 Tax=Pseudomonas sp. TaxID=306 RepID=UPI0030F2973C